MSGEWTKYKHEAETGGLQLSDSWCVLDLSRKGIHYKQEVCECESEEDADLIIADHNSRLANEQLAELAREAKEKLEASLMTTVITVADQRKVVSEFWEWMAETYRPRYDAITAEKES